MNNFLKGYEQIEVVEDTDLLKEIAELQAQHEQSKLATNNNDPSSMKKKGTNRRPSPDDTQQGKKAKTSDEPVVVTEDMKQ